MNFDALEQPKIDEPKKEMGKLLFFPQDRKSINPLKSEHLEEGVSPIMACVGTLKQFEEDGEEVAEIMTSEKTQHVNYFEEADILTKDGFKNAGDNSYIISPIDSQDKFSDTFENCTGIVAVGRDRETGKDISFMSHQDPSYFLEDKKWGNHFSKDLRKQLLELKERSARGSVDVVIVGGNYLSFDDVDHDYEKQYKKSIKVLSSKVKDILGFEPVVIAGPKQVEGPDDIYYNNEKRRLYIIRPEVGKASTGSFLPRDMKEQEAQWKKAKNT